MSEKKATSDPENTAEKTNPRNMMNNWMDRVVNSNSPL
jgi:hypothetical protein